MSPPRPGQLAGGMGESLAPGNELVLSDLVNRVLDRGVVVTGEVVISVAGIDLVYLGLDLVLSSVESAERAARGERVDGWRRREAGREGGPGRG